MPYLGQILELPSGIVGGVAVDTQVVELVGDPPSTIERSSDCGASWEAISIELQILRFEVAVGKTISNVWSRPVSVDKRTAIDGAEKRAQTSVMLGPLFKPAEVVPFARIQLPFTISKG